MGASVESAGGRNLGRVVAVIHRRDGCDVLVERRRWLRVEVVRLDIDELVHLDGSAWAHRPVRLRVAGTGDGQVA